MIDQNSDTIYEDEYEDLGPEDQVEVERPAPAAPAACGDATVPSRKPRQGYHNDRDGLFYYGPPKKGDGEEWTYPQAIRLCAPLWVTAQAVDDENRWGKMLEWVDPNGEPVRWVMPNRLLAKPQDLWTALYDRGLAIEAKTAARSQLLIYLNEQEPEQRVRLVRRLGWYDRGDRPVFVMPDRVYGSDTQEMQFIFDGTKNPYELAGTLDDWKTHVGALCRGNSRLVLAASTAFASSLLYLTGDESGGIHFQGSSRTGKTSAGRVGSSIAGRPNTIERKWAATSNGLEAVCEERCDGLLYLDELGQVDGNEAGRIVYLIANDMGKTRMSKDITLREAKTWRLLFLSSGELSLSDKMNEVGKKPKAGQEVRFLDLSADAGCDMGIVENLHGIASPGEFVEQITRNASTYYGTPLRAFLDRLAPWYASDTSGAVNALRELRDEFVRDYLPQGASPQVRTACARFGLIGIAGELATEWGITGWEAGEATSAAVRCFNDWLTKRGTQGDHDLEKGIEQVLGYIERHASRFGDPTDAFPPSIQVGWRQPIKEGFQYHVFARAWKDELCKGYNAKGIAAEMVKRGLLIGGTGGKTSISYRGQRVYKLSPDIFADPATPEEQRAQLLRSLGYDEDEPVREPIFH